MGSFVDITVDVGSTREAIKSLINKGADLRPLMVRIESVLNAATARAFSSEQSPAGNPWAPLAANTEKWRKRKLGESRAAHPILQVSGALLRSITTRIGVDYAEIGPLLDKAYGAYNQLGTSKMLAREYLGIGSQDESSILNLAIAYLADF